MSGPKLRLWYLGTPHKYDPQHITAGALSPDWYCRVYEAPVREMLSTTPVGLAEELLRMVNSGEWAAQLTRPMRLGDKFTAGDTDWVFVLSKDASALTAEGFQVLQLPSWSALAISSTTRML